MAFNFTIVFNTKEHIAQVYSQLEDKHEGPFIAITKLLTEVSLMTIKSSLEDFRDIIKALPEMMEISMPGRPKRFIALGILIVAMGMATFNTICITQLDAEITGLKSKTDLLLDMMHLHENHLHHLEEKLEQTNTLLVDLF
jgi:hypothetical protein